MLRVLFARCRGGISAEKVQKSIISSCILNTHRCAPVCFYKTKLALTQEREMSSNSSPLGPANRIANLPLNFWTQIVDLTRKYAKVNLGQGMPDYYPPDFVREALMEVAKNGETSSHQYTRGQGLPRLVNALATMFSKLHGRKIDPMNEIVVTVGAYEALYSTFMAFVNPGDEVILLDPCYDCYKDQIKLAGGKTVFFPLTAKKGATSSKDWTVDKDALEAKISDKTKAIVINTPHNPLGKVFSLDELTIIADVCKKHNLLCISDEVYEWLVFDGVKHTRIATLPGMWERTLTISSGGKTFGVTGWKVGWVIGAPELINCVQAIHTDCTFHVPTPTQEAIAACIERETPLLGTKDSTFAQNAESTEKNMRRMAAFFSELGFHPLIPEGGYFMMVDFSKVDTGVDLNEYDKSNDLLDFKFIRWLCKEKGIAVVPPSAFYSDENKSLAGTHIRVCLMKDEKTITTAENILKEWRNSIQK
ncbi:kynurenine--oxoglutarate transaminase 3 [Exaiptasia diaphana]|uniref:Aminotransferase class I/classII large domain-containing protein n=1 Tax=Exaiptasia diaphana TaxID=2652724 RepID=A0A913YP89_EXADI|nr:kynurenine--oxoglutarate transaminase 3 [Exaiptasia diaphana]KXJ11237.1 Kynurenine--oxoglutarate transaminase 3 [Exaiptasia diaphana]